MLHYSLYLDYTALFKKHKVVEEMGMISQYIHVVGAYEHNLT